MLTLKFIWLILVNAVVQMTTMKNTSYQDNSEHNDDADNGTMKRSQKHMVLKTFMIYSFLVTVVSSNIMRLSLNHLKICNHFNSSTCDNQ